MSKCFFKAASGLGQWPCDSGIFGHITMEYSEFCPAYAIPSVDIVTILIFQVENRSSKLFYLNHFRISLNTHMLQSTWESYDVRFRMTPQTKSLVSVPFAATVFYTMRTHHADLKNNKSQARTFHCLGSPRPGRICENPSCCKMCLGQRTRNVCMPSLGFLQLFVVQSNAICGANLARSEAQSYAKRIDSVWISPLFDLARAPSFWSEHSLGKFTSGLILN